MRKEVFTIAERLRREPFRLLDFRRGNCIAKSRIFKKQCRAIGVEARIVLTFGIMRCKPRGLPLTLFTVHAWGEVDGARIEVAVPLDEPDFLGAIHRDIKPIFGVWF